MRIRRLLPIPVIVAAVSSATSRPAHAADAAAKPLDPALITDLSRDPLNVGDLLRLIYVATQIPVTTVGPHRSEAGLLLPIPGFMNPRFPPPKSLLMPAASRIRVIWSRCDAGPASRS
jgi:hypothetical protein